MNFKKIFKIALLLILAFLPLELNAATINAIPTVFGLRPEFIIFAGVLVGIAIFSRYTMYIALSGLILTLLFKIIFVHDFSLYVHFFGNIEKSGEIKSLLNLGGLLFGFALLAKYFDESKLPEILPDFLPNDWKGGFVLLLGIMIISSFLDNIAAAMIGGTIAMVVFKGRVHIGYLAAIVAASNAGGAGSVVGDTTTTLMWIDGVSPLHISRAFIASAVAILIFGIIASIQQDKYQRIQKDATANVTPQWGKLFLVLMILIGAIATNWLFGIPALGVWIVILLSSLVVKTEWSALTGAIKGTIFLLSLVASASLMPVEQLPAASWKSAFILGFVSSVFDNIPLTKLCLVQGGYDWGILAYAVGFGGSMIWFGSSAGVALSNMYPEAKSVVNYVKKGWHVSLAYVVSFFVLISVAGWHPYKHKIINTAMNKTISKEHIIMKQ
jgi:Na+/H+ antiporter NhaD/arsenite permease-like protein